jgi:hypothetical protein
VGGSLASASVSLATKVGNGMSPSASASGNVLSAIDSRWSSAPRVPTQWLSSPGEFVHSLRVPLTFTPRKPTVASTSTFVVIGASAVSRSASLVCSMMRSAVRGRDVITWVMPLAV